MDDWMSGWMDWCVHGWMDGLTDGWMDRLVVAWMDRRSSSSSSRRRSSSSSRGPDSLPIPSVLPMLYSLLGASRRRRCIWLRSLVLCGASALFSF